MNFIEYLYKKERDWLELAIAVIWAFSLFLSFGFWLILEIDIFLRLVFFLICLEGIAIIIMLLYLGVSSINNVYSRYKEQKEK